jgi:hypothetical protein
VSLFNDYKVEYYDGSDWVEIPELLELTANVGRRQFTDSWSVSTASFTFRYPTGFVSPYTDLVVDVPIRFFTPSNDLFPGWTGFIKDVTASWGKPYDDGVGEADLLEIQAEGALGRWGRIKGDWFTPSVNVANGQMTEIVNHYGLSWNGNLTDEPVKAVPTDSSLMDWFQKFLNTVQGRVIDGASIFGDAEQQPNVWIYSNATNLFTSVSLSDSANDANNNIYNVLNFDSLADNFITEVIVNSPDFDPQVANVGAEPYRSFTVDTYATTQAQAEDIAQYLLATSQGQVIDPSDVSAVSSGQNTPQIDTFQTYKGFIACFKDLPLYFIQITFRGVTYTARIEGATINANPEETRTTLYLSSAEANPWLILDSSTFGILDTNKLALYDY